MSRIGRKPVTIPKGVEVTLNGQNISAKGSKGTMQLEVNETVTVNQDGDSLSFAPVKESKTAWAMTGTMRSLVNGIVNGVSAGFERKLELIGVGYRAQAKGSTLNLSLGFSHPVEYAVPEGITIETPSQTEILVKGCDKQKVGQVAANIRACRPPEPYKGKGVRYSDEVVVRKEAKKK
ncbi:50S ribosomal protein L6 [Solemya pervernicosa gill symbiont]|uniref:Large ribosomal subunit protein uL6 n=2 Tax=Gammaproteobacteria incertae sedis TaxID=118884 RepID=A0A1T2L3X8_9GAMM|nr:50S ribosomal protein L6 [Candidatus Reidiella endopervernicosa]OOZ39801.1 50S ribosomal protein L6 [Solemya pervernicosa gill symbiont]QKQ26096.1 50S ribosomal protein L6 [Candidatus Reidiella endopervernicosa]